MTAHNDLSGAPLGAPLVGAPLGAPLGAQGRLRQIGISRGGVPKVAVARARVGAAGVEGDVQADRKHHGGPDRAVCLFSLEVIDRLRAEGHPIGPGTTGENLTVSGLDWSVLGPGTRMRVGAEVELEITSYTEPCRKISGSFEGTSSKRIKQDLHPGESRLYARVVREGEVRTGDTVELRTPARFGAVEDIRKVRGTQEG